MFKRMVPVVLTASQSLWTSLGDVIAAKKPITLDNVLAAIAGAIFAAWDPIIVELTALMFHEVQRGKDTSTICCELPTLKPLAAALASVDLADVLSFRPRLTATLMDESLICLRSSLSVKAYKCVDFEESFTIMQRVMEVCLADIAAVDSDLTSQEDWLTSWSEMVNKFTAKHVSELEYKPKDAKHWDQEAKKGRIPARLLSAGGSKSQSRGLWRDAAQRYR